MKLMLKDLTKKLEKIDKVDVLSCWQWSIPFIKDIVIISRLGDLFVVGNDDSIYWIAIDTGNITKIANNLRQFEQLLNEENNIDNWFLPQLVEKLMMAGKILKETEVYSYKNPPVLGGDYSIDNIEPTDI